MHCWWQFQVLIVSIYDAVDVKVPVHFEFVSQATGSHCCKPWLTVLPSRGFIHIS